MSHNPFLNGELATLRQADLRREAADRRLATEVLRERRLARRADRDRRLGGPAAGPIARLFGRVAARRNPRVASRVVVPETSEGGRA